MILSNANLETKPKL